MTFLHPSSSSGWNALSPSIQLESIVPIPNTLDYPAITICSSFPIDRWGFLRDLLNQAMFVCNREEECSETSNIRKNFLHTAPLKGHPYLSAYFTYQKALLSDPWIAKIDRSYLASEVHIPEFPLTFFSSQNESIGKALIFVVCPFLYFLSCLAYLQWT